MRDEWKEGIAFVRGINIYKNSRIKQREMMELCKKIESKDLKILGLLRQITYYLKREICIMHL